MVNPFPKKFILVIICSLFLLSYCKQHPANGKSNNTQHKDAKTRNDQKAGSSGYDDSISKWPVKTVLPLKGAVLPFNRIVAYYGDLYDKEMGILGQLPKALLIKKLREEAAKWSIADTTTPVVMALHCITVMSWNDPDTDGKYRNRMPHKQIDTLLNWAKEINGLVFLDIQVGTSTLPVEIPILKNYLSKPNVHLGIDPEFSMKNGPLHQGQIGTFDAADVNYAIDYLAAIVKLYKLPPKILVVHRFTENMLTNSDKIKIIPEVQVVIDMDGFGSRWQKKESYYNYIYKEPVQFAGFKLFYQEDPKKDSLGLMTPKQVLDLVPRPVYIQYQ